MKLIADGGSTKTDWVLCENATIIARVRTQGFNPTLQDSDTVTYKVSGDTIAHALAKITSPDGGKIAEVSVVTEYIGLGDWRYQPMGLFGTLRFIVDPYSQARKDSVDFVLNTDYATKTVREEAFLMGEVAPAS